MNSFLEVDYLIFEIINNYHQPWLNVIMKVLSKTIIWIPLFAFLIYSLYKTVYKKIWISIIAIGVLITITDQGSNFFKNTFERPRPCNEASPLQKPLNMVNHHFETYYKPCNGYGFFSAHASNTFGVVTFLFFTITQKRSKKWWYLLWLWAALVGISRIYLGVHYPSDVIAGTIFGYFAGKLVFTLHQKLIQ